MKIPTENALKFFALNEAFMEIVASSSKSKRKSL